MSKITLDNFNQLQQEQREWQAEGEDLFPHDIEQVLGKEDYYECHGGEFDYDLLCLWADPKTRIVISHIMHGNNYCQLESWNTNLRKFDTDKEYNQCLLELKADVESSDHSYDGVEIKGNFESLLIPGVLVGLEWKDPHKHSLRQWYCEKCGTTENSRDEWKCPKCQTDQHVLLIDVLAR